MFFHTPENISIYALIGRASSLHQTCQSQSHAASQTGNLIQQKTDPAEELVRCQINAILSAAAC